MNNTDQNIYSIAPASLLPGRQFQTGERVKALVKEIDALSYIMGVHAFKAAIRPLGYDVDACPTTLSRRGVN